MIITIEKVLVIMIIGIYSSGNRQSARERREREKAGAQENKDRQE